ncbi:cation diffusion facilitator family transporter [Kineococcus sp. SYSU DK002]|uniref:cation diffusion facilitator family transporter n=1 Tax=Kineococcus sp. SYSU DK002 TaxID=3383123 RepID=UPI003D7C7A6B
MRVYAEHEMPPEVERLYRRAVRLERWTLAYLVSAVALMGLVLGQSQAMKAAWVEDLLSLLPAIAFLVASRFRERRASQRFPYGFHRVVSAAYLIASFALLVMGVLLFADSAHRLVTRERPSIGLVEVLGFQLWLGWPMIAALVWSAVPAVVLGRMKLPMASKLHDKVLYADAEMNRADWLTAVAAIVGVLGIGAGLWWADAVAAIVISLDIARDGLRNVKAAFADLIDRVPTSPGTQEPLELIATVEQHVRSLAWVQDAEVRLREHGHLVTGEVYVVPGGAGTPLPHLVQDAMDDLQRLDWRLREVAVVLLPALHGQGGSTPRPEDR